jgi:hypothetical protein
VSPSEPTPTPTAPHNANEGASNAGDEFDPDTSGFAGMFKFGYELTSNLRRNESESS